MKTLEVLSGVFIFQGMEMKRNSPVMISFK